MKTVKELNEKIWYRILKVIFILIFIVLIIGYNLSIINEIKLKTVDPNRTVITCDFFRKQDKHKNYTAKDMNLKLDIDNFKDTKFDYKDFYTNNKYIVTEILKYCSSKNKDRLSKLLSYDNDIFKMQKTLELQMKNDIWKNDSGDGFVDTNGNVINISDEKYKIMNEELTKYKDYTGGLISDADKSKFLDFDVEVFKIEPSFTHVRFTKYLLIGNSVIVLLFEFIRRIFYYVILGKLKPLK